jgi:hypothetical protein
MVTTSDTTMSDDWDDDETYLVVGIDFGTT